MKINSSWRRLAFFVALVGALSGVSTYPPASGVVEATIAPPALSSTAVTVWNQQAVALTLAAPAPPPARQTRLLAIVQTAVHDAVNGITKAYATYLPTPPPPADASPEAAAR